MLGKQHSLCIPDEASKKIEYLTSLHNLMIDRLGVSIQNYKYDKDDIIYIYILLLIWLNLLMLYIKYLLINLIMIG
jgi:hypothetical protein